MISVIVPAYNVKQYIHRCVESILMQDNVDFELIIIDDGSTDGTSTICDSYTDERIKVIHQENAGVSVARNVGIEMACGEYLLFVDSDDWLEKDALNTMVMYGNGADIIAFGAYEAREITSGGYEINKKIWWENQTHPIVVRDKYQEIFNKGGTLWNKLIRRAIIGDTRFKVGLSYGEDCDFLCRILDRVETATIVPKQLYYYYANRAGNVVSAKLDERSIELIKNAEDLYDYLVEQGQWFSGVRRIYVAVTEVWRKIPLSFAGIRENKQYISFGRKALRYPTLQNRLRFYLDDRIAKEVRILYLRMCLNPFHMYYRMLRSRSHKVL